MSKYLPLLPQFGMKPGQDYSTYNDIALQFYDWYHRELVPLFESAVEVYNPDAGPAYGIDMWTQHCNHIKIARKALLINIKPIKEETADDLLEETLAFLVQTPTGIYQSPKQLELMERAKAFLDKKKSKG